MAAIDELTPEQQADYEERAAIMQYDGGLDRAEAERLALACVRASETQKPIVRTG